MDRLSRYADLIVRVGADVQPGQTVFVNALVEHHELARELARSAYEAGARYVDVRYMDEHVRRAMIELADEEVLTETPSWLLERTEASADDGAVISIAGESEPELLADLDQRRVGKARTIAAVKRMQKAQSDRTLSWTIAACPSPGWAEQVFGEPDVERLWDAVAKSVRLDEEDPVAAWKEHVQRLRARCADLDALELDSLHFSGPGTELTVGLLPESRWIGGGIENRGGAFHVPNLPTEEVFTCPDRRRTEGTVRSTRPLALGGTVARDLEVRFEGGAIVDVTASTGADAVRGQLSIDEGAPYLGEVALVDGASRVGQTGITFFNTLFDENAACHIAYGNAIHFALPDGGGNGNHGVNVSSVHTDFMIGGPEVTVEGKTRAGDRVSIMRENVWQL